MKITKSELKKLIKRTILEDRMGDRAMHLHAPRQEEPGEMGVSPEDMRFEMANQFSQTGHKLADLWKSLRTMREMASEMSNLEAEGFVDGSMGTEMHHKLNDISQELRSVIYMWNELDNVR